MSSANRISDTTILKIKRFSFEKLKQKGLAHGGTIFGGFVRDEFISEYYIAKYKRENPKATEKQYWRDNHSPATRARTLLPSDMDISFTTEEEVNMFINDVRVTKEFNRVHVIDRTRELSNQFSKYYSMHNILRSIKQLRIQMQVGSIPFINEGHSIVIFVDVMIPNDISLQPPFNNLDMLCNGFIMTGTGDKTFSKHTGTIIDQYNDYEKAVVVPQILRDMRDFKTVLCMTTAGNKKLKTINIIALNRITKMLQKSIPWSFINMPFRQEIYQELCETNDCCICSCDLQQGDHIAYTVSYKDDETELPAAKVHSKCMMKYLHHQRHELLSNQGNKIVAFKCPYRNPITFTRCKLDVQFAYRTDL